MNFEIIINVFIAIAIYNIILKAVAATILREILKSDKIKPQKEKLRDEIKNKLNETNR